MAHKKLKQLVKAARPFMVAALAVAILSNPFSSEAELQNKSYASVLMAHSSIAGLSTQVELEGDELAPLEVSIIKPSGAELVLQTTTDDNGRATLNIDSHHVSEAGEYQISTRHLGSNEGFSAASSFEVYAGSVSDLKSTVSVSQSTMMAGETIELTVALKDDHMNPLKGHVVKMIASDPYVDVYSPEFTTNQNGEIRFYALANGKGDDYLVDFAVMDTSSNTTLRARPKIAVIGEAENPDQGGFSNAFSSVILSAEAGPLDHFDIEIAGQDDDQVVVGDELTIVVTAQDEDNNTVTDYTGTLRFSSTDGSATLPNDYTFLAEDAGSKEFSLAVKFVTPGEQTISVNDTDKFTIDGEFTLDVVTDADYDAEYEDDFVDNDFERDGDFSLISPASGSYSEDAIEVQGSAQYGYSAIIYVDGEEAGRTEVDFDNSFAYTVSNLEDGTYDIYAEVVELGDGEEGEEEILEVIEASDIESVTIDTEAPELVSIETDPEDEAETDSDVEVIVLSEGGLDNVSILFNDEIYELEETTTSGKYMGTLPMPSDEGEYGIDVVLSDDLGNDVQYRDQIILTLVSSLSEDETQEDDEDAEVDGSEESTEEPESEMGAVSMVEGVTTVGDEEMVIVSWESPESLMPISYYKVYYGPSSDALFAISQTFDSSTSWRITNLPAEEVYYFAVSAVDVEGNEGELSEAVIGIPVAVERQAAPVEERPQEERPALNELPPRNPETGAGTGILLAVSGLGAAAFTRRRR